LAIGACETKESTPSAMGSAIRECTDEDLIAFPHVPFQDTLQKQAWGDARSIEASLLERSLGVQILLREGQVDSSAGTVWKSEIVCVRGLKKLDTAVAPLKLALPYRVGERGVRHRILKVDFAQEQIHFRFDEGRAPRQPVAWVAKRMESGFSVLSHQESQNWEVISRSTLIQTSNLE
jgi:hypothetical protein